MHRGLSSRGSIILRGQSAFVKSAHANYSPRSLRRPPPPTRSARTPLKVQALVGQALMLIRGAVAAGFGLEVSKALNVILPPQMIALSDQVSAAALALVNHIFHLVAKTLHTLHAAVVEPWAPLEAWYIIAWQMFHKSMLKSIFYVAQCIRLVANFQKMNCKETRTELFSDEAYADSFFGFLERPVGELVYVYWFLWSVDMLQRAIAISSRLVLGIDEAAYTLWATSLVVRVLEHYIPRTRGIVRMDRHNPGASDALVRLSTLAAYTLGAAGVLQAFGLTTGAIGLASVGGLAFSLASRSVVENVIGGVFIIVRQPFRVGEHVQIKDIRGRIARVGWLTTEVVQVAGPLIYLPNATFISSVITNYTRNTHARLEAAVTVFLPDADKVPRIVDDIERFISSWALADWPGRTRASPRTLGAPRVFVSALAQEGMTISIAVFLGPCPGRDSAVLAQGKHELYTAINNILVKHEARVGAVSQMHLGESSQLPVAPTVPYSERQNLFDSSGSASSNSGITMAALSGGLSFKNSMG